MIHYRTFGNVDPPGLADVWNASFTGRGSASLPARGSAPMCGPTLLEYFGFAKPYFDPQGLVVATADGLPVGFAHAGFGPDKTGAALDTGVGVTCLVAVMPAYRRQGIGSELLRRCEDYLRRHGARELHAGPLAPLNPFTFGLYGGSQPAGFLDSDPLARPFFESRGYRVSRTRLVFQRPLDRPAGVADARFPAYRQRFEIHAQLASGLSWWQESVLGPVELLEYRLRDRASGAAVARATLWEMETYSLRWGQHAVGLVDLEVVPELRRQGLAKFLLVQMLRHLHEQFFALIDVHADADDQAGVGLLRGLGFEQVDVGRGYRREGVSP